MVTRWKKWVSVIALFLGFYLALVGGAGTWYAAWGLCPRGLGPELVARVRSQLRRYTSLGDVNAEGRLDVIVNGRLTYDPEGMSLKADGEPVKLTATETRIVDLLMRNLGRIFPAEEIYRRVWEGECYAPENTVMVHIRRIREKIELNPKKPEYLKVVWGIGYKMEKMG